MRRGEIAPGNGADWNYRYWAADVHDFAWTASPHFRVSRRMFEHTGLPPVEMQLLLNPSTPGRSRATSTPPRSRSATANGSGRIHIATSRSSILPFKAAAAAWSADAVHSRVTVDCAGTRPATRRR